MLPKRQKGSQRPLFLIVAVLTALVSVYFVAQSVELDALRTAAEALFSDPLGLGLILLAYGSAFLLRAWMWGRVLPALPVRHALAALHVSLAGNHVLPLRLGEALRVTSVVRRARIPFAAATASTLMLRGADVLAVIALGAVLGPRVIADLVGAWAWVLLVPAIAVWAGGLWWIRRLVQKKKVEAKTSLVAVAGGSAAAWVLESVVMWQACRWAGLDVSFADSVLVSAITIAAQILAITPGGIGTYEAAATAALVGLGFDPGAALAAAITAHAVKTAYSLVTGGVALFVPSPGAFGRLRLPRSGGKEPPEHEAVSQTDPIVLFMPARNEEGSVAKVVARAPEEVRGHPVTVIVVNDGSTDATAMVARAAGAEVVPVEVGSGLGAAVREGLSIGVERRAAAVAFCDADGEYAPEELERLVSPILEGRSHYTVGSRFSGEIDVMRPHRRAGNHLLTALLRYVARTPITDGQSGYRAFSRAAAANAEVVHDFNYAQVLTLDLIEKGFGYDEVPISYSFRQSGRSYIRLMRYLRHVLPAVHREINGSQA